MGSFDEDDFTREAQPMDVIGMGLVTHTEMSKIMAPSINKTLKRTIDRKRILSEKESKVV